MIHWYCVDSSARQSCCVADKYTVYWCKSRFIGALICLYIGETDATWSLNSCKSTWRVAYSNHWRLFRSDTECLFVSRSVYTVHVTQLAILPPEVSRRKTIVRRARYVILSARSPWRVIVVAAGVRCRCCCCCWGWW